ncbi:flagellar hook-associated protein 2 [Aquisalibacillus elongatus]|uniref:Flagellar hook-associated protein 2 n=1 Tax=Aquisalibacillus elongatus TaxID=485577 RepID=A0A3N5BAC8_9BACI|nr:flagellar hook-associated protein 2 [Aquisalibacillus elongatus]RPF54363.1 flagellar hook-associated protein 2 [Aquisalibacillus elongatus]
MIGNNSMRIGGLATGMDIDTMVEDLMKAERIPMNKMEQDQTLLTWERDAYREVNSKLSEFDSLFSDLTKSRTYESKSASSTNEQVLSATATRQASESSFNVEVDELASKAMNYSQGAISNGEGIDPEKALKDTDLKNNLVTGELEFYTYNENGDEVAHSVQVEETDSLNDVFNKISDATDGGVRAFYDQNSDQVFLERTETGNFNKDDTRFLGAEIGFNGSTNSGFLTETLEIKNGEQQADGSWEKVEVGGKDASFKYNGIEMTSNSNDYEIDGVELQFNGVGSSSVNVQNDDDALMDKITGFVDKYNEVVDFVSEKTSEERHRDYPPLTDAQKEEMSEREIELWEEKAKSGMLRSDSILERGLSSMRSAFYSVVDTGEDGHNLLADIGITTSSNYRDNGKLEVDRAELRAAIQEDPEKVKNLLHNDSEGDSRGVINRVQDELSGTMEQITNKAGNEFRTQQQYSMGRELISMAERMTDFERRMTQTENRYWQQFTQMEKAIQRMNQQSQQMMSQFGGGQ